MKAVGVSYWDGHSFSTGWYDPNESVYYIQSAADLCGLSHLLRPGSYVDFEGKEVILMVDVDLKDYEWETLGCIEGSYYYSFNGVFNGNGKTISGLKITKMNNGSLKTIGLFGVLMEQKTVIKNLVIEGNIDVATNGTADIGAIAGTSMATIYNCVSNVNISVNSSNASTDINVGSIVGKAYGLIRDCQAQGDIRIRQDAVSGCRVGGIAGSSVTSDVGAGVVRCKSATDITIIGGEEAMLGGISSLIRENNSNNLYMGCMDINGCHFAYAGGIVASMSSEVKNCLMLGSFTGYGDYYYKGAIMATKDLSVAIDNCYYKEGLPNSSGFGTALSENILLGGEALSGFDTSIWDFSYGEYPDLSFEFEDLIEMPKVRRIELDEVDITLTVGSSRRLFPTFYPSGVTEPFYWASSDENVAIVSSSGLVVAQGEGIAYITIKTSDDISASCRVEVQSPITANERMETGIVAVEGGKGEIVIKSPILQEAYIYTMDGKMMKNHYLHIGTTRIPLSKGTFIVKIREETWKVMVR